MTSQLSRRNCGDEFTLSRGHSSFRDFQIVTTFTVALKLAMSSHFQLLPKSCTLHSACQIARRVIEETKQMINCTTAVFQSKKGMKFIQKPLEIEKDTVCELAQDDKHRLRKSEDRKAQISKAFAPLNRLFCALRSVLVLRWYLLPRANLTHNVFFYFQ